MKIEFFDRNNPMHFEEAACLLQENFQCWSDKQAAKDEIAKICTMGHIALVAIDDGQVVGLAGARPQYDGNVWELHPIVIRKDKQKNGIGRVLIAALESEVVKHGGITMYLGTDDENDATSLSNVDIYEDTFEKIRNIRNLNRHPYEFYVKCGYQIVGIVPDANGYGKPDIMMAKRLRI